MPKLWLAITLITLLAACVEEQPASTTLNQGLPLSESNYLENDEGEIPEPAADDKQSFYFSYDHKKKNMIRRYIQNEKG